MRRPRRRDGGLARVALIAAALVLTSARIANAGAVAEFESALTDARADYDNNDYQLAETRLAELLRRQPEPPAAELLDLVNIARAYHAATLLFLNRADDATAEFQRMLRSDPDVFIDQEHLSAAVARAFRKVRDDMLDELHAISRDRNTAAIADRELRAARERTLREMLTTERVVVRVPRGLTFVPFGVGQFANGNAGLGAMFATLETLATAAAVGPYVYLVAVSPTRGCRQSTEPACFQTAVAVESVSLAVLGAIAIGGIVQANLAWQPERVEVRHRPLPSGFETLRLAVAPAPVGTGFVLGGGLRF